MAILAPTIVGMATPKKKPPASPKKVHRTGAPLHVWIDPALRDALEKAIEKSRRKLNMEVSIALEEYLTKHGFWPAKTQGS